MSEIITQEQESVAVAVLPEVENSGELVVAANPGEMQKAQITLVRWGDEKLRQAKAELEEAQECHRVAVQAGWNKGPFTKRVRACELAVNYYEKVVAALEEGYCIVPNFPVTLIAIKRWDEAPSGSVKTGDWRPHGIDLKPDTSLGVGEGEYVDPVAKVQESVYCREEEKDSAGKVTRIKSRWWEATEFRDVSLPVKFMKPRVLEATQHAMAMQIFDEVGVLPARKKSDPVVIGRILGPNDKQISFLISWFVDRKDL